MTTADLKASGTHPSTSEQLTSFVKDGSSISMHSLIRNVGKESNRHDFVEDFVVHNKTNFYFTTIILQQYLTTGSTNLRLSFWCCMLVRSMLIWTLTGSNTCRVHSLYVWVLACIIHITFNETRSFTTHFHCLTSERQLKFITQKTLSNHNLQ